MNALVAPSVHEFINSTGMAFKVRAAIIEGKEWFVAADVCTALGLNMWSGASPHVQNLVQGSERVTLKRIPSQNDHLIPLFKGKKGSTPQIVILSESGLYRLIMRCDKADARPFQDWVTRTVLPSLRKDGAYVQGEEKVISGEMSEEELLLKAMTILNRKVERLAQERDELKAANVSLTPKASAYELIFDQDGLVRLSEVQKAIRVRDTRINLNAMTPDLIRMGWLYQEETGVPTGHRESMTQFRNRFQFGG